MSAPAPPHDFEALRAVSARFGADPLLVQGAGGNTSVKAADAMWIKASGTRLAEAATHDIFVAVDCAPLRAAVERDDPAADDPARFGLYANALRPSIETCLHALFPQRIVLHVHCVETIAVAVRWDARAQLADRLKGFAWAFVDYAKPGAALAAKVRAYAAEANIIVLCNHGLIVAGDTVAEAAERLEAVVAALRVAPAASPSPDLERLAALGGEHYVAAPQDWALHGVALTPARLRRATAGALYPDHVVFCGPAAIALAPGEDADRSAARLPKPPPFLLAPGAGALVRRGLSLNASAMARCLGDVLARVPEDAEVNFLGDADVAALVDWDAEIYRRALDAR